MTQTPSSPPDRAKLADALEDALKLRDMPHSQWDDLTIAQLVNHNRETILSALRASAPADWMGAAAKAIDAKFIKDPAWENERIVAIADEIATHAPSGGFAAGWAACRKAALDAQPSTAEDPDEDSYQRGRFDGVMEYGRAIATLSQPSGEEK